MVKQLHKRLSNEEIKILLQKYWDEKIKLSHILKIV